MTETAVMMVICKLVQVTKTGYLVFVREEGDSYA